MIQSFRTGSFPEATPRRLTTSYDDEVLGNPVLVINIPEIGDCRLYMLSVLTDDEDVIGSLMFDVLDRVRPTAS